MDEQEPEHQKQWTAIRMLLRISEAQTKRIDALEARIGDLEAQVIENTDVLLGEGNHDDYY